MRPTRVARSVRLLSALALGSIATVATVVVPGATSPSGAQLDPPTVNDPGLQTSEPVTPEADLFATACPELTDSVYRLYRAFFGREPDAAGWENWMSVYVRPETNLESISNDFVMSDEFQNTYGSLDNAQFVRLVYNNVMGREPDADGNAHWVGSLDNGYSRGAVMIAFSESAEYVQLTDTWPPLAGYLQWYSRPLEFACGNGPTVVTPQNVSPYADLMIWNDSTEMIGYRMGIDTPSGSLMDVPLQLDPSSYSIYWNMEIRQIDGRSVIIEVPDRADVFWTAVFYDAPHAPDRSPYTDGFGLNSLSEQGRSDDSPVAAGVLAGDSVTGFAEWSR